jgi:DNA (cytosine-5)-methyltransferase 1
MRWGGESVILDLYAGAGGWDEGARLASAGPLVGIDNWLDACRTAHAAGHPRVCADIATYPTTPFTGRVRGLLGSPPCTPYSTAGKGLGKVDKPYVHELVDAFAAGHRYAEHAWTWNIWADPLSHHAAQPVRWIRDLRPDWVCLEQVPGVLPLWQHIGRVLTGWGYSVWTGKLCAADYGVPQTRTRAFLIASRSRRVGPPPSTHYDPRRGTAIFGTPWVSMAQALGWDGTLDRLTNSRAAGNTSAPSAPVATGRPGPTLTSQSSRWKVMPARTVCGDRGPRWAYGPGASYATGFVLETEQRSETAAGRVPHLVSGDRPAPVVVANADRWELHAEGNGEATSKRVGIVEAAVLQGFRPDYPWHGNQTSRFGQVSNAVPPPLAGAVIRAAIGGDPA